MRPAVLGAAALGMVPFRVSAPPSPGWWRSQATAHSALVTVLVLALLVASLVQSAAVDSWQPSSVAGVLLLARRIHGPLLWAGAVVWAWRRPTQLQAFFTACRQHEAQFGALDLRSSARYVRRFVAALLLVLVFCVVLVLVTVSGAPAWLQLVSVMPLVSVYGGVIFWVAVFIGCCWCLQEALGALDGHLQTALDGSLGPAAGGAGAALIGGGTELRQLRLLVRRHGELSRLVELLSDTFGGFISFYLYMLMLDVALSVYLNLRPFSAPLPSSLGMLLLHSLLTPLPLILLKLATNAGQGLGRQTRRAAGLLRRRLPSAEPELAELLHLLEGQQTSLDMAGYFTLDSTFFIQSLKDVVTLLIVMAQFEMA